MLFDDCRICGTRLSEVLRDRANRSCEKITCESPECIEKDLVSRFGCCDQARLIPNVVGHAFACVIHGTTHKR